VDLGEVLSLQKATESTHDAKTEPRGEEEGITEGNWKAGDSWTTNTPGKRPNIPAGEELLRTPCKRKTPRKILEKKQGRERGKNRNTRKNGSPKKTNSIREASQFCDRRIAV